MNDKQLKRIADAIEEILRLVKKKNVYGNERIYPVCQDSIIFSYIAGTKTFCSITIANIKKLGYKFETQKEDI